MTSHLICLDEFVLIASEEGIYSLNLNEIHDASLELVSRMVFSHLEENVSVHIVVSSTNNMVIR